MLASVLLEGLLHVHGSNDDSESSETLGGHSASRAVQTKNRSLLQNSVNFFFSLTKLKKINGRNTSFFSRELVFFFFKKHSALHEMLRNCVHPIDGGGGLSSSLTMTK